MNEPDARRSHRSEAAARVRRRHRPAFLLGVLAAAIIVVVAVVVAADRDDAVDYGAAVRGVSVVGDALLPPGTPLGPGVDVQPGSVLVGSTFPLVDFLTAQTLDQFPIGWQALLLVDGDPVDVWNAYAQALRLETADATSACTVSALPAPVVIPPGPYLGGDQEIPERFLTEAPLDAENRLDCHILTPAATMTMAVGVATCRTDDHASCPHVPIAHLKILVPGDPAPSDYEQRGTDSLRRDRGDPGPDEVPTAAPIPDGPVIRPTLDGAVESGLPQEGERFDAQLDPFLDRTKVAIIPPGGRSLVAPAMLLACNSGLVTVLDMVGTLADAVAAFDRAYALDDPVVRSTGRDTEGRSWAGGLISAAGGEGVDIVALDTGDGHTTVSISECGD